MWRRWSVVVIACTLLGAGAPGSQEPTLQAPRPVFRSGVDVVSLNVTVVDAARRHVTTLERGDFVILEDGRNQELNFFSKGDMPLALAVLLDTSASMGDKIAAAQEAAVGFVQQLQPRDVVAVIDFDTRARILHGFTNDHAALAGAIRETKADGSTALYNAVYIALKELNKVRPEGADGELPRRALVVLSDGDDTSSLVGFDEVSDLAVRSDTAIYTIGIGMSSRDVTSRRGSLDAEFALRRLAQQTGGRAFFPLEAKELVGVYREITDELSSQYAMGYASTNSRRDGRWRSIAVRLRRDDIVARTKPGYFASNR